MTPNPWNDDRKVMLKQWWLHEQKTSTEIVLLFGRQGFHTTRNAVIGAVHRSDWWEGLTRTRTPPKPRAKKPEGWRRKLIDKTVKKLKQKGVYDQLEVIVIEPPPPPPIKLRTPPPPPPPPPAPGKPMYLSVVQVGYGQCRFWYGESRDLAGHRAETGYCGHKVEKGHSWCPEHLRLVYAKGKAPAPWVEARPRMSGHIITGRKTP